MSAPSSDSNSSAKEIQQDEVNTIKKIQRFSPTSERRYKRHTAREFASITKLFILVLFVVLAVYVILVAILSGVHTTKIIILLSTSSALLVVLLILFGLTFTEHYIKRYNIIFCSVVLCGGAILKLLLALAPEYYRKSFDVALFAVVYTTSAASYVRILLTCSVLVVATMAIELFVNDEPVVLVIGTCVIFVLVNALGVVLAYVGEINQRGAFEQVLKIRAEMKNIKEESKNNETLLMHILPKQIVKRLKAGDTKSTAQFFSSTSILFASVINFEENLRTPSSAKERVKMLHEIFSAFDYIVMDGENMEKIKTIGCVYMAASGVPVASKGHAAAMAELALQMMEAIEEINIRLDRRFQLQIGINSGSVAGGVLGTKRISYDVWGDTVNLASRVMAFNKPNSIQITKSTAQLLGDRFNLVERGVVNLKGKGDVTTYFLLGRKNKANEPCNGMLNTITSNADLELQPQRSTSPTALRIKKTTYSFPLVDAPNGIPQEASSFSPEIRTASSFQPASANNSSNMFIPMQHVDPILLPKKTTIEAPFEPMTPMGGRRPLQHQNSHAFILNMISRRNNPHSRNQNEPHERSDGHKEHMPHVASQPVLYTEIQHHVDSQHSKESAEALNLERRRRMMLSLKEKFSENASPTPSSNRKPEGDFASVNTARMDITPRFHEDTSSVMSRVQQALSAPRKDNGFVSKQSVETVIQRATVVSQKDFKTMQPEEDPPLQWRSSSPTNATYAAMQGYIFPLKNDEGAVSNKLTAQQLLQQQLQHEQEQEKQRQIHLLRQQERQRQRQEAKEQERQEQERLRQQEEERKELERREKDRLQQEEKERLQEEKEREQQKQKALQLQQDELHHQQQKAVVRLNTEDEKVGNILADELETDEGDDISTHESTLFTSDSEDDSTESSHEHSMRKSKSNQLTRQQSLTGLGIMKMIRRKDTNAFDSKLQHHLSQIDNNINRVTLTLKDKELESQCKRYYIVAKQNTIRLLMFSGVLFGALLCISDAVFSLHYKGAYTIWVIIVRLCIIAPLLLLLFGSTFLSVLRFRYIYVLAVYLVLILVSNLVMMYFNSAGSHNEIGTHSHSISYIVFLFSFASQEFYPVILALSCSVGSVLIFGLSKQFSSPETFTWFSWLTLTMLYALTFTLSFFGGYVTKRYLRKNFVLRVLAEEKRIEFEQKQKQAEELLCNIFPRPIYERIKSKQEEGFAEMISRFSNSDSDLENSEYSSQSTRSSIVSVGARGSVDIESATEDGVNGKVSFVSPNLMPVDLANKSRISTDPSRRKSIFELPNTKRRRASSLRAGDKEFPLERNKPQIHKEKSLFETRLEPIKHPSQRKAKKIHSILEEAGKRGYPMKRESSLESTDTRVEAFSTGNTTTKSSPENPQRPDTNINLVEAPPVFPSLTENANNDSNQSATITAATSTTTDKKDEGTNGDDKPDDSSTERPLGSVSKPPSKLWARFPAASRLSIGLTNDDDEDKDKTVETVVQQQQPKKEQEEEDDASHLQRDENHGFKTSLHSLRVGSRGALDSTCELVPMTPMNPVTAKTIDDDDGGTLIADSFSCVTILHCDIVGFTVMAAKKTPQALVRFLNDVFGRFDDMCSQLKLEKIKTIGDAYVCVAGIPMMPARDQIRKIAVMALAMMRYMNSRKDFRIRIGIHSGPIAAGIVGVYKCTYDIWGDSVGISEQFEHDSVPGKIQVSERMYRRLCRQFELEPTHRRVTYKNEHFDTYYLNDVHPFADLEEEEMALLREYESQQE